MTPSIESWFDAFISRHMKWNPGPGWNSYAADEDIFELWIEAFERDRVVESEAIPASKLMAAEPSLYPEHHLPRLLTIIRQARPVREAPTPPDPWQAALAAEQARRDERSALVEAEWALIDEPTREAYRAQVRAASPGLGRFAPWAEALAKDVHAEWMHPELMPLDPDGRPEPTLEGLRRGVERADPKADRPAISPPTPAVLTAEQERAAIEKADGVKRSQLARLRAFALAQTAAPEPEPRRDHAHAV